MSREIYNELKNHFKNDKKVVVSSGTGAQGIKKGTKMFAMFSKGDLVLKLPADRVQDLIKQNVGFAHPEKRPAKNYIRIPNLKKELWIELTEEAKESFTK